MTFKEKDDWITAIGKMVTPWILLIVAIGIVFFSVDAIGAKLSEPFTATVVERVYTPVSSRHGYGTGITSNGKIAIVSTHSYEPEKWTVIVMVDGRVVVASASAHTWEAAKEGKEVHVAYRRGLCTGRNWGWVLLSE